MRQAERPPVASHSTSAKINRQKYRICGITPLSFPHQLTAIKENNNIMLEFNQRFMQAEHSGQVILNPKNQFGVGILLAPIGNQPIPNCCARKSRKKQKLVNEDSKLQIYPT